MKVLFLADNVQSIFNCYSSERVDESCVFSNQEFFSRKGDFTEVEYIFSTWGMPTLSTTQILEYLPSLKAVFYGAGTVSYFAKPFLELGISVFSAWAANAIPVAEYTVAQIVLANKGFFQLHRRYRDQGSSCVGSYANTFPGNYKAKVGLLGFGMIGKAVVELLKPYNLDVYVYCPYLSEEEADSYGVFRASMEYVFEHCQTVSNHLANKEETVGILDYSLFSLLKKNAVFINTGRGAQVVVPDLIRAMEEEPNRTALLDVTDPQEPLSVDDPLWNIDNIVISPHRAGSRTNEVQRLGDYMFEEYTRLINHEETQYEITLEKLKIIA